jgi:hypothetical protein
MVQVHLMELFATNEIYASMLGKVSLFMGAVPAAPVFMVIMGYFAFGFRLTGKAVLRGLKILLLGLALNISLNAHLLLKILSSTIQLNPFHYIFGADILFLAGFSMIVIAILKRFFAEKLVIWVVTGMLFAFGNSWLPVYTGQLNWVYYVQALGWGEVSWSYFPIFPWMVYPLLGVIFHLIEKKYKLILHSVVQSHFTLIILFLFNIPFFRYGFGIASDLPVYYHHPALFVLWVMLFMSFWTMLFYKVHKIASGFKSDTYLVWVGKNVTVFYIIQWLIIGNMATTVFRTQSWSELIAWFFAVVLTSSILVKGWIVLRIMISSTLKTQ